MSRNDDLYRIFIDLFKNNKKSDLSKRFSTLTDSQLIRLVENSSNLKACDFIDFLKACFSCLTESTDNDNDSRRNKLVKVVLITFQKSDMETSVTSAIITIIYTEIDKLHGRELVDLISYYFDALCNDGICNPRWIEILPKLFQNVNQLSSVDFNDDETIVDGKQAQDRLLTEFCEKTWHPSKLGFIVGALKEINLSKTVLVLAVEKTLHCLKQIPIIDVPPVIYQLLLLINMSEKTNALRAICKFFTDLDEVENSDSCNEDKKILKEVEGTVMVHVMFAIKQNQDFGRIFLNMCKANHHFALKPFNTALLLSVSQISRFTEQVLDLFKTILMNCLKTKEKMASSLWIRSTTSNAVDVETILTQLTKDCSCGWDYVLDGLRELGLCLLETHLPKVAVVGGKIVYDSNVVAHTACRWGELIVLECFKQHYSIRTSLIRRVMDAIFLQSSSALYFIELLARFVDCSPQSVLECKQKIFEHFEHLPLLPHNVAVPFIKVFMPLVKLKPDLRDKLVEILKKAIFSKEIEARKTAVSGFLLFLRYLQVMNAFFSNSQSQSQSFPTFSSQVLSIGNNQNQKLHYEKLCLEIVCCLRKAMSQQGEVRKMLYIGLFHAARHNKQILPPVVDLLSRHLDQYVETDDEKLPPLYLSNCVATSKDGAVLMEPLGCLIQSLHACFVLADSSSALDENTSRSVSNTLSSIVKKLGKSELEDFALDKSADYSHDTTAGSSNALLAFELLSVYEAALEFCWKTTDYKIESAEFIAHLQECHSSLTEVLREKCVVVGNKKGGAGKVNVAPTANAGRSGVGGSSKKQASIITIDLVSLYNFIETLLCDKEFSRLDALNYLRGKIDFLKWIFFLTHSKMRSCLMYPKINLSKNFETLCKLARLMLQLYTQDDCIVTEMKRIRLNFLSDSALEIFTSILDVVCVHYSAKLENFLNFLDLHSNASEDEFAEKLYKVIRLFTRILIRRLAAGNDNDEESDDKKQPKQILCLIRIVEILLKFLPPSKDQYEQVYNSVLVMCEEQSIEEAVVAKSLWALLFQLQLQIESLPKKLVHISQNVYRCLGDANNEDISEPSTAYSSINAKSVNSVLHTLVHHLDIMTENNNYVITKLKQNLTVEHTSEEERDKVETDCCDMCGLIIAVWQDLLKANIPLTFIDSIIRSLQKFYAVLTLFARYNLLIYQKKLGRHCARFEKLTKKSLADFTPNVYKFLSNARTLEDSSQSKKKRAQNTVAAKTKIIREMKVVTSLIYTIENYEKSLIQLGSKCKINFMQGAKPSTNCDFRIDQAKLRQALTEVESNDDDDDDGDGDGDEEHGEVTQSAVASNVGTQESAKIKRKSQNRETVPSKRKK